MKSGNWQSRFHRLVFLFMTVANQITMGRIVLIPVFIWFAAAYGDSFDRGSPEEWLRLAAIIVFLVAAVSDGLDGFVARKWHQKSRLGAILDPLADKGLLFSALLVLTFSPWPNTFPLWFPLLVIGRDVVIVLGTLGLGRREANWNVRPSFAGKAATAAQMISVVWIMLSFPWPDAPIIVAALLTLVSGVGYVREGILRFRASAHNKSSTHS
jgi:cardiolipin synthase